MYFRHYNRGWRVAAERWQWQRQLCQSDHNAVEEPGGREPKDAAEELQCHWQVGHGWRQHG